MTFLLAGAARHSSTINTTDPILGLLPAGLADALGWLWIPIVMLVLCGAIVGVITVVGLLGIWAERKVAGHIQNRLGPMEVGPHGLLQTLADGVKLLAKEDVIPKVADKALFIVAPIVVFAGVFVGFVVLPFSDRLIVSDLNLGIFFIAAVGSIEAIGVVMAGWSSNNKWSLFGAMRTATQVVSYEIPMGMTFLVVILAVGSFSMMDIVVQQKGWFWCWYVFRNPFFMVAFVIYYITALAECKRAPFDLPEAESELVAGFHTEYSGMRFSIFFLAEYAAMYAVSAIAVALFLGGWYSGIPAIDAWAASERGAHLVGQALQVAVFLAKATFLFFVQLWLRWTLPRVRLDQVMYLCLKVLLPFGFVCLLGASLLELVRPDHFWGLFDLGPAAGRW